MEQRSQSVGNPIPPRRSHIWHGRYVHTPSLMTVSHANGTHCCCCWAQRLGGCSVAHETRLIVTGGPKQASRRMGLSGSACDMAPFVIRVHLHTHGIGSRLNEQTEYSPAEEMRVLSSLEGEWRACTARSCRAVGGSKLTTKSRGVWKSYLCAPRKRAACPRSTAGTAEKKCGAHV